mgnify:CR=1 FL=1
MSRSTKKGPYVAPKLLRKVEEMNKNGEKIVLKTWSRSSTIFPDFVGHTFAVHDGRKHVPVYVTEDMLVTSLVNLLRQELQRSQRIKDNKLISERSVLTNGSNC